MAHIRIFSSICIRSVAKYCRDMLVFEPIKHFRCNVPLCNVFNSNRRFCSSGAIKPEAKSGSSSITFIDRDGDKKTVSAKHGDTLLDVAKNYDVDLEGACEGTLSCSTCHLIFDPEEYAKIELETPSDEELDMLDLAYGLTPTSRLGCQIEVTERFDGITLKVPAATRDARDV